MDILNTTKVKHLSTCKHWKTKLAERKEKKKIQWKKKKEVWILQIETYPQKLQFGILPTKQESMWELNSARKGDTLCILNKYKVNRNYNLFMRFYRVWTWLKV